MNPEWAQSTGWYCVGWTMLHFFWVGTAIGLFALVGRTALRSSSTQLRYCFSLLCFTSLAVSPLLIFTDQAQRNGVAGRNVTPPHQTAAEHGTREGRATTLSETRHGVVSSEDGRRGTGAPATTGTLFLDAMAFYLPWLWIVGGTITIGMTLLGLGQTERLRRCSERIEAGRLANVCHRLAAELRVPQRVALGVCDRISSPALVGVLRPMILVPASAVTGWPAAQLEMALIHELVHLRRWDHVVNLGQRVVESVLFFHPMVWVVSRWLREDREYCCDQAVIEQTGQPFEYAQVIASLAFKMGSPPQAIAMDGHPVVERVRRILAGSKDVAFSRGAYGLLTLFFISAFVASGSLLFSVRTGIGAGVDVATDSTTEISQLRQLYAEKLKDGDLSAMAQAAEKALTTLPTVETDNTLNKSTRSLAENLLVHSRFRKGYVQFALGETSAAEATFRQNVADLDAIEAKKTDTNERFPPSWTIFRERARVNARVLATLVGRPLPVTLNLQEGWVTEETLPLSQAKGRAVALLFRRAGDGRSAPFLKEIGGFCSEQEKLEMLVVCYYTDEARMAQDRSELEAELSEIGYRGAAGFDPDVQAKSYFRALNATVGSATFLIVDSAGKLAWFQQDPRALDVEFAKSILRRVVGEQ